MILAICLMILILLGHINLLCQLQHFITLKIKRFFFLSFSVVFSAGDWTQTLYTLVNSWTTELYLQVSFYCLFCLSLAQLLWPAINPTVRPPGSLASLPLQTRSPTSMLGITRLMSGLASVLFDFKVCNIFSLYLQHVGFLILSRHIYPDPPR